VLADITRRIAPAAAADDSNFIEAVRRVLPEGLSAHLKGARIRDGVLVVYAESAAWAARLRQALNEHISTPGTALPGLSAGARVVARVMPRGGYRR
jgi:predicted nucleic acid-binding Zn ribbon protein